MTIAVGPFAIAATLLTIGGVLKAAAPADTATALRGAGLPFGRVSVRVGGAAEAGVGVFALATGSRSAAVLVAVSFLSFAIFVGYALRRDLPIATCGCFGRADTPPSVVHVVLNLAAVASAIGVAVDPGASLPDVLRDQPLAGIPFLVLVTTGVYLAFVALTSLPRLMAAVRLAQER